MRSAIPALALLFPVSALAAPPTSNTIAPIDREIATVLPTSEEDAWMQVPWRTNIFEAIQEAGKAKKPVFLWVMNGNPLGCA